MESDKLTKSTQLKIDDAKRIAMRTRAEGVIVLTIPKFGADLVVKGVSYGSDRARCSVMGRLMDKIIKKLRDGDIEP